MFLNRIVETKKQEVEQLAGQLTIAEAEKKIAELPACRGFEKALRAGNRHRALGLIAEVKKASPSKGLIREDFHPVALAKGYEAAGADCISVLTDEQYFQGKNQFLTDIRSEVNLPLLRKDFIIDPLQIYEARLIGADCILLIVAILTDQQLSDYYDLAKQLGMDVLVEVHDEKELQRVLQMNKATLIGINNRNLHTFETNLETTAKLIEIIPSNVIKISESGILSNEDYEYVRSVGAEGLLIGEHFMRQGDVGAAIETLMGKVEQ
ncbi:indole-3-glycerol phosphate synthase TrpC [Paenibacillus camelliae]|uniref:indole-3-glycerol phosphate synthase TrpC n=1 Tax=Paenibacillus camelliae TaxID=512410 RepID=UPI00203E7AD7|nr:indole-3-glycerol phosphate synthase TrpC [Paenibacillus camelliae]MCM3633061.1 indole-3-glycerol phosphate synthase TrpC [Paenibacillus camelliae]